jgi:hypothetical protein
MLHRNVYGNPLRKCKRERIQEGERRARAGLASVGAKESKEILVEAAGVELSRGIDNTQVVDSVKRQKR